jgi:hypothetical protein
MDFAARHSAPALLPAPGLVPYRATAPAPTMRTSAKTALIASGRRERAVGSVMRRMGGIK